ncbi:hypothetical protein, partial [Escherichia coli]
MTEHPAAACPDDVQLSGQPIATVMAVYIHLLVSASRNVTRGH